MYEENMHTLYRFNTLSNTRKHVIYKRKRTKVHYQYKSYETMHWFELLMLWFSDLVSEREKQGWLFGWNDPARYYSELCLKISNFFDWRLKLYIWKCGKKW